MRAFRWIDERLQSRYSAAESGLYVRWVSKVLLLVLYTRRTNDISPENLRSRFDSLRDTLRYLPEGDIRCYLLQFVLYCPTQIFNINLKNVNVNLLKSYNIRWAIYESNDIILKSILFLKNAINIHFFLVSSSYCIMLHFYFRLYTHYLCLIIIYVNYLYKFI